MVNWHPFRNHLAPLTGRSRYHILDSFALRHAYLEPEKNDPCLSCLQPPGANNCTTSTFPALGSPWSTEQRCVFLFFVGEPTVDHKKRRKVLKEWFLSVVFCLLLLLLLLQCLAAEVGRIATNEQRLISVVVQPSRWSKIFKISVMSSCVKNKKPSWILLTGSSWI